jgi:NADPH-dependent 2,4-dienoyl-CoA reductase/sulfur reductase-like enzyme/nitrite reductase/ring-hydroxylating ferredoxin subunit
MTPPIAKLSELAEDHATRVQIGDTPILLVRTGDTVHAYSASCPHAGAPLDKGALCAGRIVCPWHKGTFDAATGDVVEPPALTGLTRYRVTVDGDNVSVDVKPVPRPAPAQAANGAPMRILIVGAGAAGAAACAALREFGFNGHIAVVDDDGAPYDRTTLSKFVPAGEMSPDDVPPLLPADFFDTRGIERITGRIDALDTNGRKAALSDGRLLEFDAVLLACGAKPVVPALPGRELQRVFCLRTRADARALVDGVRNDARVVIVGSSFIGLEVASALRKRGVAVTIVAPEHVPFSKQFGERFGKHFQALHEANGVTFRLGAKVRAIVGPSAASAVELEDGTRVPADAVLFATGVAPATSFVSGLTMDDQGGIPVDTSMRAAPGVFAAGDIAAFPLGYPYGTPAAPDVPRIRIEHWRVAQQQARVAARALCGDRSHFAGVPFFWTYHYGKRFDYLGYASDWDEQVVERVPERNAFAVLYLKEDRVVALLACGYVRAVARLSEAMRGVITKPEALEMLRDG